MVGHDHDQRFPNAHDGDALAAKANAVLENYKSHKGMVLRSNSVPRTPDRPAEHFFAVVFGRSNFIEVACARFKLVDGVGCSIVYSHRIYGEKVGDQMSAWLNDKGAKMERTLMDWSDIPSPASLRELPREQDRPSGAKARLQSPKRIRQLKKSAEKPAETTVYRLRDTAAITAIRQVIISGLRCLVGTHSIRILSNRNVERSFDANERPYSELGHQAFAAYVSVFGCKHGGADPLFAGRSLLGGTLSGRRQSRRLVWLATSR